MSCCPDSTGVAGACFSPDRRRRFALWRNWDWGKEPMAALMLNPSIADESELDPTLRRVQRYAQDWGFGGMVILNAFALVSTDPSELRGNAIGADIENDAHILDVVKSVPLVMVGWGTNLSRTHLSHRVPELRRLLRHARDVKAWRLTSTGQPCHPLYLPANIKPVPYGVTE